jgi:hypothetical protein
MSVEQLLHDSLLADAGVAGIIGTRLYFVQIPQGPDGIVYPLGCYQPIALRPLYIQTRGRSPLEGGQATIGIVRMQLMFWATGPTGGATMLTLYEAIMAAMENFNAITLPTSPATIFSAPNRLVQRILDVEPSTQPPLARLRMDFEIWYQDQ